MAKTATASTTPRTTTPPAPSRDAQGQLICPDATLAVAARTGAASYTVGSQPLLGMAVTNIGKQTCVRDLGGALQVYTVYNANGARIWSTADCAPGTGTDVRTLAPGKSESYLIRWAGTTSTAGCDKRTVPPAGTYTLIATLDGIASPPRQFTLLPR